MACAKDLEEDLSHHEATQMIRMVDPTGELGGVDETGFVNLMKELGLWGKSNEK